MVRTSNKKAGNAGGRREAKHGGSNGKKDGLSGSSFFTWFMVIALLGVWTSVAVVWFDLVNYEDVLAKAKDFRYNLSEVLQDKLGAYDADGDGDFDIEDAKVLLGLKERAVTEQAPEDSETDSEAASEYITDQDLEDVLNDAAEPYADITDQDLEDVLSDAAESVPYDDLSDLEEALDDHEELQAEDARAFNLEDAVQPSVHETLHSEPEAEEEPEEPAEEDVPLEQVLVLDTEPEVEEVQEEEQEPVEDERAEDEPEEEVTEMFESVLVKTPSLEEESTVPEEEKITEDETNPQALEEEEEAPEATSEEAPEVEDEQAEETDDGLAENEAAEVSDSQEEPEPQEETVEELTEEYIVPDQEDEPEEEPIDLLAAIPKDEPVPESDPETLETFYEDVLEEAVQEDQVPEDQYEDQHEDQWAHQGQENRQEDTLQQETLQEQHIEENEPEDEQIEILEETFYEEVLEEAVQEDQVHEDQYEDQHEDQSAHQDTLQQETLQEQHIEEHTTQTSDNQPEEHAGGEPSPETKKDQAKKKKPKLWNKFDKTIKAEIDAAEKMRKKGKVEEALRAFETLVVKYPQSPKARYGKAQSEDDLAEKLRSNEVLLRSIGTYEEVSTLPNVPSDLAKLALKRRANRQQFLGRMRGSLLTLLKLVQLYPDDMSLKNDLGVAYLLIGDNTKAKEVYEEVLSLDPDNGFAKVHYGFILKADNKIAESIPYLREGLLSGEPGTDDGRFYFHLGDALQRVGDNEAYTWYEAGHKKGHFASVWQRSLYNVDGLKAQPWWTAKETGYTDLVRTLEANWKVIRDDGLAVMDEAKGLFVPEDENLREKGDWSQYTLWQQGRKNDRSCKAAPRTCALLDRFPESTGCRRGQIKYSVMHPGTHVWPHTGPTNCRLRMHLGLVIPKTGCRIRCANDTRAWEEGKVLIFDDSFEHEVWQDANAYRLIFIVDVWHPELTQHQRRTLPAI